MHVLASGIVWHGRKGQMPQTLNWTGRGAANKKGAPKWAWWGFTKTERGLDRVARLKSRRITKFITMIVNSLLIRSRHPIDFEAHQIETNIRYIVQIQRNNCTIIDDSCQFSYISYIYSRERCQAPSEFLQFHYLPFLERLPNHIFRY